MGVMIDPNLNSQAHTSLEIRTPVQYQTILEETVSCLDVVRHGTFAAARNIVFVRWFQARFRCQVDHKMQDALNEQERERHRIFPQNNLESVA